MEWPSQEKVNRGAKMILTPISDMEAAKKINVSHKTIRNAVKRGTLTRMQMAGQVQHVAEEQVMLFSGKKLLKDELSTEELRQWQIIDDAINQHPTKKDSTWGPFTQEEVKGIKQQIRIIQQLEPKLAFKISMMLWGVLGLWIGQGIISHDEMSYAYYLAFPGGTEEQYKEYRKIGMADERVIEFSRTLEGYPETSENILPQLIDLAKVIDLAA